MGMEEGCEWGGGGRKLSVEIEEWGAGRLNMEKIKRSRDRWGVGCKVSGEKE